MLITGVKHLMPRSGSDNEIRACILIQPQELHRGMGIIPWMQICLPQCITLLIQKTKTGVFDEIISWPCRGHLVYITLDLLTQPVSSQHEWEQAVEHFTLTKEANIIHWQGGCRSHQEQAGDMWFRHTKSPKISANAYFWDDFFFAKKR